jgi:hypothetical protein
MDRDLQHNVIRLAPTRVPILLARLLHQTLPVLEKPAPPRPGRPSVPLHALVYQAVMRVFCQDNQRVIQGLMDTPWHRHLNHYGGIGSGTHSQFMISPTTTPLLEKLLAVTTWPVRHLEHLLHPDGTGLTETHLEHLPGGRTRHTWHYMEALWTYRYTMIAALHSQRGPFGEAPWLPALLTRARLILEVREFGGDRAYDASYIRDYAAAHHLDYQVQLKRGSHNRAYAAKANRRNNAETGNHAFKTLLGGHIYSRDLVAQRNEVLCMAIAYNLIRLIHVELEQGIQIRFSTGARRLAQTPWLPLEDLKAPT